MPRVSFEGLQNGRSTVLGLAEDGCMRQSVRWSREKNLCCLSSKFGDLWGTGKLLEGEAASTEEVDSDISGLPVLWLSMSPPKDEESLVR